MSRITPYRLLLFGMALFAANLLAEAFLNRTELAAILRLGMGLTFFAAFFLCLKTRQFAPEHRVYVNFFLVLLVYVAILAFPNFLRFHAVQGFRVTVSMELGYYSMLAFGLVLLTLSYAQIVRLIQILLASAVLLFLFMIPRMDAGAAAMVDGRGEVFRLAEGLTGGRAVYNTQMSLAYVYGAVFLAIFAFRMNPLWRLLAGGSLAFIVMTALYYSKRATLLDLVMIGLLFVLVHGMLTGRFAGIKKFQFIAFAGIAVLGGFIGLQFFGGGASYVFENLLRRFDEFFVAGYQLTEFSRIREVEIWFQEAPFLHKFFGGGPMGYHRSGVTGNVTTGLHIGWAKLFVKGGPVLLCFFAWIFFKNVTTALRFRQRPSALIGLALPIFFTAAMVHSSVFDVVPAGFAIAIALFLYPALFSLETRRQAPLTMEARSAARAHPAGLLPHGRHQIPPYIRGRARLR